MEAATDTVSLMQQLQNTTAEGRELENECEELEAERKELERQEKLRTKRLDFAQKLRNFDFLIEHQNRVERLRLEIGWEEVSFAQVVENPSRVKQLSAESKKWVEEIRKKDEVFLFEQEFEPSLQFSKHSKLEQLEIPSDLEGYFECRNFLLNNNLSDAEANFSLRGLLSEYSFNTMKLVPKPRLSGPKIPSESSKSQLSGPPKSSSTKFLLKTKQPASTQTPKQINAFSSMEKIFARSIIAVAFEALKASADQKGSKKSEETLARNQPIKEEKPKKRLEDSLDFERISLSLEDMFLKNVNLAFSLIRSAAFERSQQPKINGLMKVSNKMQSKFSKHNEKLLDKIISLRQKRTGKSVDFAKLGSEITKVFVKIAKLRPEEISKLRNSEPSTPKNTKELIQAHSELFNHMSCRVAIGILTAFERLILEKLESESKAKVAAEPEKIEEVKNEVDRLSDPRKSKNLSETETKPQGQLNHQEKVNEVTALSKSKSKESEKICVSQAAEPKVVDKEVQKAELKSLSDNIKDEHSKPKEISSKEEALHSVQKSHLDQNLAMNSEAKSSLNKNTTENTVEKPVVENDKAIKIEENIMEKEKKNQLVDQKETHDQKSAKKLPEKEISVKEVAKKTEVDHHQPNKQTFKDEQKEKVVHSEAKNIDNKLEPLNKDSKDLHDENDVKYSEAKSNVRNDIVHHPESENQIVKDTSQNSKSNRVSQVEHVHHKEEEVRTSELKSVSEKQDHKKTNEIHKLDEKSLSHKHHIKNHESTELIQKEKIENFEAINDSEKRDLQVHREKSFSKNNDTKSEPENHIVQDQNHHTENENVPKEEVHKHQVDDSTAKIALAEKEKKEEEEAATRIQRLFKKKQEKKKLKETARPNLHSEKKQKNVTEKKNVSNDFKKENHSQKEEVLDEGDHAKQHTAAVQIQKVYRGKKERAKLNDKKIHKKDKVEEILKEKKDSDIQIDVHQTEENKEESSDHAKENTAAVRIQKVYRGKKERAKLKDKKIQKKEKVEEIDQEKEESDIQVEGPQFEVEGEVERGGVRDSLVSEPSLKEKSKKVSSEVLKEEIEDVKEPAALSSANEGNTGMRRSVGKPTRKSLLEPPFFSSHSRLSNAQNQNGNSDEVLSKARDISLNPAEKKESLEEQVIVEDPFERRSTDRSGLCSSQDRLHDNHPHEKEHEDINPHEQVGQEVHSQNPDPEDTHKNNLNHNELNTKDKTDQNNSNQEKEIHQDPSKAIETPVQSPRPYETVSHKTNSQYLLKPVEDLPSRTPQPEKDLNQEFEKIDSAIPKTHQKIPKQHSLEPKIESNPVSENKLQFHTSAVALQQFGISPSVPATRPKILTSAAKNSEVEQKSEKLPDDQIQNPEKEKEKFSKPISFTAKRPGSASNFAGKEKESAKKAKEVLLASVHDIEGSVDTLSLSDNSAESSLQSERKKVESKSKGERTFDIEVAQKQAISKKIELRNFMKQARQNSEKHEDKHTDKHDSKSDGKHENSHEAKHVVIHEDNHEVKHDGKHGEKHENKHEEKHLAVHENKHDEKHADKHEGNHDCHTSVKHPLEIHISQEESSNRPLDTESSDVLHQITEKNYNELEKFVIEAYNERSISKQNKVSS